MKNVCVVCGHDWWTSRGCCTSCWCFCKEVEKAIAAWPHLLARVLYVPGLMAAVSQREWYAGVSAALAFAAEGDPGYGWSEPVPPDGWPS